LATYAIGDIQGCFRTFERLLARFGFNRRRDRLWVVGDLVNRGPRSLEVLRWMREHDDCATVVLGNHDLHLLARAAGIRKQKRLDTLDQVLAAPDARALLDWLRCQALLHREGNRVLVHAGLLPSWTVAEAARYAKEVETALRADNYVEHLAAMYEKGTPRWTRTLSGGPRLRAITAVLTRIRTCTPDGVPDYGYAGPVEQAPAGLIPWFRIPGRKSATHTIIFGHWAALGLHLEKGIVATDSACVWGEQLSAVRLSDGATFSEPNAEEAE
jgi:bis(5'-nucleosyl)-tetraphosphatase (symmetrical)